MVRLFSRRQFLRLGQISTLFVLSFGLGVHPAPAQTTAAISGAVKDASGGAIAGVAVDAVVDGRAVATATTGSDGLYRVQIPAGVPFALQFRRDGFADQIVELAGITNAAVRDVAMQIGRVSDTLVVTASRGAESRDNVTESVTVATRADIQALGTASLADIIRFVPGVNLEATGREGGLTSLFVRGGESDYNLVLVDGVRVNLSGGQFDFSRIGGSEIDRVEVVRGAQSSLWGSDAMGSVVQVFTRRAGMNDAPQVTGSLEGGSFDAFRGDARVTGGLRGRLDYQAGVTRRQTNGAFSEILPDADRFDQTAFDGGFGATLGARASVRTGLRYSRSDGRSPGQIVYGSRDTGTAYNTRDLSWHLTASHSLGARFTGTGTINYFRYSNLAPDTIADPPFSTYAILEGTPDALFPNGTRLVRLIDRAEFDALSAAGATPGPGQFLASAQSFDFPSSSATEFRRPGVRYQGDYTWAGQRLSAGYEWERETNPLSAAVSLDNNAFFVQQQLSAADRWFVTLGGRVDSKETFETSFNPKLSIGGFLLPLRAGAVSSVKIFGNVGKGLKSPTFGERFGGPFADPDPNLKPEHARTGDVGVEATFANQRLRGAVTYFNNDYRDQVAYRSGKAGDGIPDYINVDGSHADGWELEVALQRPAAGFSAAGIYSLVDTKVVTNVSTSQQFQPGQPLLRRPKHSGTFRAAYSRGRATVNFDLRVVGKRHDNSFLFMESVPNPAHPNVIFTDITVNPGYTVAGLGVDFRASRALTIFLRGDNIGDTTYESALGYPGLPRAAVVGLRFTAGASR